MKTYVVTYDFDYVDGEMRLFVNGELAGVADVDAALYGSHSGDIAIGSYRHDSKTHTGTINNSGAGSFFEGLIGEFTYNNRSLEDSEVVDLHAHLMNKWMGTATTPDYETATSHDVTVQVTDAAGNTLQQSHVDCRRQWPGRNSNRSGGADD